ncbi:MAG: hypothetical protein WCT31_04370 [Candidatus Micrarchaeia archaeon]|jgi:hypothetical protein
MSKKRVFAVEELNDAGSLVYVVNNGREDAILYALEKLKGNWDALGEIAKDHPYQWVRKRASELLGVPFADLPPRNSKKEFERAAEDYDAYDEPVVAKPRGPTLSISALIRFIAESKHD